MLFRLIPPKYRNWLREMIEMSGMKTTPSKYLIKSLIFSIIIAVIMAVVVGRSYMIYVFVGIFCAVFLLFNGWLILAVDKRRDFVEKVLPDALELTAANIRAGFIPSKALLLSARSEFGPLAEAIKRSGKDIFLKRELYELA